MSQLARLLSQHAREAHLGRDGAGISYDAATIKRWTDGTQAVSRPAAWLLDKLFVESISFESLRDSYVLALDQEIVPNSRSSLSNRTLSRGTCLADAASRNRLIISDSARQDEEVLFIFLSIVDCGESRQIIRDLCRQRDDIRILGLYDLIGRWDVAAKFAVRNGSDARSFELLLKSELVAAEMARLAESVGSEDVDAVELARNNAFTAVRSVRVNAIQPVGTSNAQTWFLSNAEDYDLLRVQRAFLLVELTTVAPLRRAKLTETLHQMLSASQSCSAVVEAYNRGDDAVVIEILMTCSAGVIVNEVNRAIEGELTRFFAQKYTLLAYAYDEVA